MMINKRLGTLDKERNQGNLLKEIERLAARVGVLEAAAVTGDPATQLGYGAFGVSARVYNSSDISIADSTWTNLTFDSERFDLDAIHDTSANTDRLTCQTAGVYVLIGNVRFAANATGNRAAYIIQNGANILGFVRGAVGDAIYHNVVVSTIFELAVADYVKLAVYQSSGGALNVEAVAKYSPEFMMVRVA